ncbi:hypothetical protein SMB93_003622 [Cronobacter sakazakii]|nr:hypothetical protein [Cronobacter sakazakii]
MSSFNSSMGGNGYMCLPGGLILQWGAAQGGSKYTINFPIAFPIGGFVLVGMAHTTDVADVSAFSVANGFIRDKKSAYLASARVVNGGQEYFDRTIQWYAIGK